MHIAVCTGVSLCSLREVGVDRLEQREFVQLLARRAVSAIAPEELPFFAAATEAYFRDPDHSLGKPKRSDEALGSGFDVVITLLSPVALAVAGAVYQALTEKAGKEVVRRGGRLLARLLRRRRGVAAGPPITLPLSESQRAEVRRVATERARELGLDDEQVRALVEAIDDGLDG